MKCTGMRQGALPRRLQPSDKRAATPRAFGGIVQSRPASRLKLS
jgi:hypothetical protein